MIAEDRESPSLSTQLSTQLDLSIPLEKHRICQWMVPLLRQTYPSGPIRGAEIGVKKGELASLLLRNDSGIELLLVDRWAPAPPESQYARNGDPAANASVDDHIAWHAEAMSRLARYHERIRIWHGEATLAAGVERASKRLLDFVFIDGDHSYEGRTDDLCDWYPLVRSGGIVAGGLLHSSFGGDCGRRALNDFLRASHLSPVMLMGPANTWAFVKP